MNKIQNIYSLKEVHNLLENIEEKGKTMVWFDFDLSIVQPHEDDEERDVLIENKVTKDLFSYMMQNGINFAIVTARFYDIVCNNKKRDLKAIKDNIEKSIFPILKELGINVAAWEDKDLDDKCHLIKSENGRTIGCLYKGIVFSGNKGQSIKQHRKESGMKHTTNIFIDDLDPYLKSVVKHVPDAIVLRRHISP